MDNYHLTKDGDQWKLKQEGASRATKAFGEGTTKQEAVQQSAGIVGANGGSLKIHKTDGTIQEERTYPRADDPKKSPG